MNNKIITTIVGVLIATSVIGQTHSDTVLNYIKSGVIQRITQSSGSDRANWSGFYSGFMNFTTADSSSITFSPTLYALWHLHDLLHYDSLVIDSKYFHQRFMRNLQINAGVFPVSQPLSIKKVTGGFTFAIINNKGTGKKELTKFINKIESVDKTTKSIKDYIKAYRTAHPLEKDAIDKSFGRNSDTTGLTEDFKKDLRTKFGISGPITNIIRYGNVATEKTITEISESLKNKPLWTISANGIYSPDSAKSNSVKLASVFSLTHGKSTFELNASYKFSNDSIKIVANLDRSAFEFTIGGNVVCGKKDRFEIKPALDEIYVSQGLYKKEKQNTFNFVLTPRLKLSDKVWFPVTIKYDPAKGQFLGLFTVQYSL